MAKNMEKDSINLMTKFIMKDFSRMINSMAKDY